MDTKRLSSFVVRLCAALLALAPTTASAAEPPDPEQDLQVWDQIYLDGNLDRWAPGLRMFFDFQIRRMNAPLNYVKDADGNITDTRQNPNTVLMVRPGIGYAWAPWGAAYIGYAWVPDFFDDGDVARKKNISEHRIFEQFNFKWAIPGRLELSTRIRVEQRFRDTGPGSADVVDGTAQDAGLSHWAFRYRQQFRIAVNFVKDKPWQFIAWDEPFFHLNATNYPSEPGFDHNRAFVGVGYDLEAMRVELGYMNQYVHRFKDPNQVNHVFSLNWVIKLGGPKTQ